MAACEHRHPPALALSSVEGCVLAISVLYAAVSRAPLVLFPIYMIDELGFSLLAAGATLALCSFGRLLGAHMAGIRAGMLTLVLGTAAGGVAWGLVLALEAHWAFVLASFALGFTETVTGLDVFLKLEGLILGRSSKDTQLIFRYQLVATTAGVFLAYAGGGALYYAWGIAALGFASLGVTALEMVLLAMVARRRRLYRKASVLARDVQKELDDVQDAAAAPTPKVWPEPLGASEQPTATEQPRRGSNRSVLSFDPDTPVNSTTIDSMLASVEVHAKVDSVTTSRGLMILVVACFFLTTFGISTQFAICVIYWKRVWTAGSHFSGSLMAIGEVGGTITLLVLGRPAVFNSLLTKYFRKPANVVTACLAMAALCYLTACDNIVACAVGTVGLHVGNVCIHSFQAEIIGAGAGAEDFHRWITISYVVKRLANTLCVFAALVIFANLTPQATYHALGIFLGLVGAAIAAAAWCLGAMPCQGGGGAGGEPGGAAAAA